MTDEANSLNFTMSRIENLFRKGSPNTAFLYLKEVLRLTIRFIAGHGEPTWTSGPCVSRDQHGIPHIFDSRTRGFFLE